MYKEYYDLWTKYTATYGPRTAIFLMVGSFYELYDIQDETGRTKMNVKDIVDILGIQLKVKRGDAPNGADGLFSGFPDYVLHKWAGKLTGNGWTVIVVDQVKDRHDKVVERRVARVLSPGTHIEALGSHEAPTIVSLRITDTAFAAAAFDLSTGSTYTTSGGGRSAAFSDELLHFLSVFLPRELIVYGSLTISVDDLAKQLDLPKGCAVHTRALTLGALDMPLARSEYLRRLYAPKTILPLIEYLQLGNVEEEKALAGLLRFVEDHEPSSFTRLKANQSWHPDNVLLLGNHALSQLQIIGGGHNDQNSVLDLFKYTATTPFGKRALRTRLLSPSADAAEIRRRLDAVAAMDALPSAKEIFRALRNIYDLPRLHRKMVCSEFGAPELLALQSSYVAALEIMEILANGPKEETRNTLEFLTTLFDLERAATENPNQTWLPPAAHPDLAAIEGQLEVAVAEADAFLKVISEFANGFRFESKESQPYAVRGTRTALTTLKASLGTPAAYRLNTLTEEQRNFTVSIQKGGGWVESAWLDRLNGRIVGLREQLTRGLRLALPDVCAAFCDATSASWTAIEEWIAGVDCSLGLATEARARNWCRPVIVDGSSGGLKTTGLRHPLIETLMSREAYVAHDVEINAETHKGWLVYGMNASGKSSLMKSIGIAVHLAQVGCYVPATDFTLTPYSALFTRILNQDNLWAGLSSFAVEMSEMRDILKSAGPRTLVLGDELCSGTESVSAKALVAAGIEWLAERGASYVFATHLHGLTDVLPPPESISLKVWHLKVIYDSVNRKLIYERHLTPGPGSSLYGIEVARAMNVPVAFLEKALTIRRRLLGTVSDEEAPRSTWNSAIVRRACEMCGADAVGDLEVHHINQRADGGSNDARNLMVLCAGCHDRHHADSVNSVASQPLTLTSDGLERIVPVVEEKTPTTKAAKAKWTEEEKATILRVLSTYPNLPAKQVVFRLKQMEGIEISEGSLRKFKNGNY